jgi:signal transduction histidine kinase
MFNNGIHISEWIASLDVHKPFYLAIIDKEGLFSFTNSRFYTEFLSSHSEPLNTSFFELVPQSDQSTLKDTLAAAALQEDPITTQIRVNNGLCRWVKWEVTCISGYGEPEKYLCMGYDIADEVQIKRTEEILGLNYQTIVEDMTVGVLLQDTEGRVITANRKAAEIFNTTLEELYTAKALPFPCRVTAAGFASGAAAGQPTLLIEETPFSKTLRAREAQTNVVINIPLPRGRNRTLLCNWQPLFESAKSVPYSVLSTFQDISKEKQFEKEARQLENQLAEHRLTEQKSTAEAIIRAQEDERTRIGHELHDNINQILASGKLYVSHLKKGSGDFEHVRERALELLELAIEEVRTLSKAMVLPDLKKGGLVASIDDLVTDLRYSNLFEVDFSHSETVGLEEMNQSKKVTLFRIVQEQIKNILKYSQAGKVEMALHIQNNWVRLEVKDDGVGFDPEKIKRGLGLSNIYERARLYDGEVRLCAAPGKGCTMVVSMPLEKA